MQGKPTPGIRVRHSRACPTYRDRAASCKCKPTFEAWVFDRRSGEKRRKTFATASAAKMWRRDAAPIAAKGAMPSAPKLTLSEAWDAWIAKAEAGEILSRYKRPYAPSALRGYRADMTNYVLPDLGARRLSDVTWEDMQSLVERLQGLGLSGSKIRNVVIPTQALYRRHRRDVLTDPTDGLDLPETGGRRERAAAPREAAALLEPLGDDEALYATAFYAGLRRGELRALRVENLRGLDGEGVFAIKVEHGWDDVEGERDTKSKASQGREVPGPETLRLILAAHIAKTGRGGHDLVFGRSGSTPFTPSHIRKRAAKAWAAAAVGAFLTGRPLLVELEPIKLHECRHSYSSFLDAAGISEARTDRYMGHSNSSVAARYKHQLDGQLAEDAARLEEYLTGAGAGKVVALSASTRLAS